MAEESSPVKVLAKFKDNLLVFLTFIYGLGYVGWAFHAYNNNLGVISAVESQYLISGLPPFLLIFFIYIIFYYNDFSINFIRRQFIQWKIDKKRHLFVLIIISWIILQLLKKIIFDNESHIFISLPLQILFGFILYLNFCMIIIFKSTNINGINSNSLDSNYTQIQVLNSTRNFLSIAILINILAKYYLDVYPYLPQEFGGVKPKKCLIEISKTDYLLNRKDNLINKTKSNDSSITITDTLLVYYYNDEKLIVKDRSINSKTYELSRNITKTIIWLN